MVYRRVVMVRLILMFMLRYFWVSDAPEGLVSVALEGWFQWVSIGFKFQTPQRGWFQEFMEAQ